ETRPHPVPTSPTTPDSEVTSSPPWAISPKWIDLLGSRSMIVPSPIPTIGSFHERRQGAPDR
ncbi:hypothetical protein SELMODRAFT_9546, partial [Selaginella moellendorffii]